MSCHVMKALQMCLEDGIRPGKRCGSAVVGDEGIAKSSTPLSLVHVVRFRRRDGTPLNGVAHTSTCGWYGLPEDAMHKRPGTSLAGWRRWDGRFLADTSSASRETVPPGEFVRENIAHSRTFHVMCVAGSMCRIIARERETLHTIQ